MHTGQVYIASLKEWFRLKTADIEILIDTVPAYTENEFEQRRIDSKEAEKIAKDIAKSKDHVVIFLNNRDNALEIESPGDDPEDNYKIRVREIEAIDRDYDVFLWVYEKFLDVLILNKDEAIRFITSRPHILKSGAPATAIVAPFAETPASVSEMLPDPDAQQAHISKTLWAQKAYSEVCDDMRAAGFKDDAIAYALHHWRGIKSMTEIGTILRGAGLSSSGRDKHARKVLKEAGTRYHTD